MELLNHPLITQRYFFPRSDYIDSPTFVPISCGFLRCYYSIRSREWPTLVFFHGNGECVADYVPDFVTHLSTFQINLFFAEYRGYGGSDGTPQLKAMLDDVHAIHQFLMLDPASIIVFGRSVGSIYALEYASVYPIQALILESGIASPLERILLRVKPGELGVEFSKLQSATYRHFNHQQKISSFHGKTLIMHAKNDFLVDVSHATRLAEWAKESTLRIFPFGNHNSIFWANQESYLGTLREFFKGL